MKTKKLILTLLSFALLPAQLCFAQQVRVSIPFPSISSQYSPLLEANIPPNSPQLAVCAHPANQVPCTNYATTYTSSAAACPNGAQDTPDPQPSSCQADGDAQGNLGFWINPGTYDYTVCIENTVTCLGPYTFTAAPDNLTSLLTLFTGCSNVSTEYLAPNGTCQPVSGGGGPTIQVNEANTADQNLLDFQDSDGTIWVDNGGGSVIAFPNQATGTADLSAGASGVADNPWSGDATHVTIVSNVLTITYNPASFTVLPFSGEPFYLADFSTNTFLNTNIIFIDTVDRAANTFSASFSHADVDTSDTGNMAAPFYGIVSYGGLATGGDAPASAPTNPGFLWIRISTDFLTYQIESTSGSDASTVNFVLIPL